jgi:Mrp family chromosome partitioning ATPase/predicted Fe-Mo cluster-binding NifX family protein
MSGCQSGTCGGGSCGSNQEDQKLAGQLSRIRNKLLVMSGKGGVGKSSVAAYLALGLARRGFRVGLMDVDLHGPSIPHMLGLEGMCDVDREKQHLSPMRYTDNLGVMSIACLMPEPDAAIIWRGPVKHGVITQFVSDVEWGDLDYLVIDSPPGTGDEPLSVAQTVPDAQAVVVTTPQEVALADVRKSINFCRKANIEILGLVENMSGFVCPQCNAEVPLFSKGGGEKTAKQMNVRLLGNLPFDTSVVESGDAGKPVLEETASGPFIEALDRLVGTIEERCEAESARKAAAQPASASPAAAGASTSPAPAGGDGNFRLAVPLAGERLTNHFGHCERFAVLDVEGGSLKSKELLTPPPHEPGVLPRWLSEMGVNLIIAGGMGQRALDLFAQSNIRVITGAPNQTPEELLSRYLEGTLVTGANVCDH